MRLSNKGGQIPRLAVDEMEECKFWKRHTVIIGTANIQSKCSQSWSKCKENIFFVFVAYSGSDGVGVGMAWEVLGGGGSLTVTHTHIVTPAIISTEVLEALLFKLTGIRLGQDTLGHLLYSQDNTGIK